MRLIGGFMSNNKSKGFISRFFSINNKISLDDEEKSTINDQYATRNNVVLTILAFVCISVCVGYFYFQSQNKPFKVSQKEEKNEMASIVTSEFEKDNVASAEKLNASEISEVKTNMEKMKNEFQKKFNSLTRQLEESEEDKDFLKKGLDKALKKAQVAFELAEEETKDDNIDFNGFDGMNNQGDNERGHNENYNLNALHEDSTPRYADAPDIAKEVGKSYSRPPKTQTISQSIETFTFKNLNKKVNSRTWKNYVPTGSFVNAVMTGGAEVNAGVSGESSTSPVTFRMLNNGFLPNGKKSKLKDCVMTASAYGDISSQRGIIRGDRLSCIRPDDTILDIPVEATVFNHGKNGVRGDAIMRNSQILKNLGVAGFFGGVGASVSSSSSDSTSYSSGATSINVSDMPMNILGNGISETASNLSDYFLALAESYHPDIDIHQGALVTIVFLKGFPLTGEEVEDYSKNLEEIRDSANSNDGSIFSASSSNPISRAKASVQESMNKVKN